jgi:hypothetical protein
MSRKPAVRGRSNVHKIGGDVTSSGAKIALAIFAVAAGIIIITGALWVIPVAAIVCLIGFIIAPRGDR